MPNYEKHGTLNLLKIVKYIFSSYLNIIKAHYIRTSFTKFRLGIFIKNFANYRTITSCPKIYNFTSHILLSCYLVRLKETNYLVYYQKNILYSIRISFFHFKFWSHLCKRGKSRIYICKVLH